MHNSFSLVIILQGELLSYLKRTGTWLKNSCTFYEREYYPATYTASLMQFLTEYHAMISLEACQHKPSSLLSAGMAIFKPTLISKVELK